MDISIIISIVSAIIALLSAYTAWHVNNKLVIIEEKRDEEKKAEAKKALIIPEIVNIKRYNVDWKMLRITNKGNSIANNVQVLINGKTVNEEPLIRSEIKIIPLMAPGASFNYLFEAAIGEEAKDYYNITVKWDDDFGKDRQIETTVSYI